MAYQYFRRMPRLAVVPLAAMSVLFILVPALSAQTSLLILPAGALSIGLAFLFRRRGRRQKSDGA